TEENRSDQGPAHVRVPCGSCRRLTGRVLARTGRTASPAGVRGTARELRATQGDSGSRRRWPSRSRAFHRGSATGTRSRSRAKSTRPESLEIDGPCSLAPDLMKQGEVVARAETRTTRRAEGNSEGD